MKQTYTAADLARAEDRAARAAHACRDAAQSCACLPNDPGAEAAVHRARATWQFWADNAANIRAAIARQGVQTVFDTADPYAPRQLSF